MQKQSIVIEPHEAISEFRLYLYERENAQATIDKYLTDIRTFCKFLNQNYEITKQRVLEYKEWLQEHYEISSANSMLAALSQFLEFLGVSSMKVKRIKVQRQMILQENQLLSEEEYHRLIKTAYKKGQKSLGMIMETIAVTGIRISELRYFTVNAVRHLFARMYYQLTSDISGLADILGHSSIETTRIYTADSEQKYLVSMERLELILSGNNPTKAVTE